MSNMKQQRLIGGLAAAGLVAFVSGSASAQTACRTPGGPDVIVGDITGPANYTATGGYDALSLGTVSCNMGDTALLWNQCGANTHPVIGGNLYRFRTVAGAGQFEQVGQSWLKHAFQALTGNVCCSCTNPGTGSLLGVGCSDPYTATRNGSQGGLGPKYQVNAFTGAYPIGCPPNPSGGNNGRLEVLQTDLVNTAGGTGAAVRYFGESQYIATDDATTGNGNNNASVREVTYSSGATFGFLGSVIRERSAIEQWQFVETGVTTTTVIVPGEGKFIIASKATPIAGGMYHYEYAVYNMNSDRSAGSFSVPVQAILSKANIGFHGVVYRAGDGVGGVNYSSTAWTSAEANGSLTWSTQTQTQNSNANAIRWGTTYNFRFDTNIAPVMGSVTLGLWKSGSPGTVSGAAQVPGTIPCVADMDNGTGSGIPDGGVGIEDLLYYLDVYDAGTSRADVDDGTGSGTPDGGVGIEDLLYYLTRYDAGC